MNTSVETPRFVPVLEGDRPVGAWVAGPGGGAVTFRPVVDVTRLAASAVAATAVMAGAVAIVAVAAAAHRRPAIGTVSMGPGGWVSVKRSATPPLRSGAPRPWWAHLLRARRLVAQR